MDRNQIEEKKLVVLFDDDSEYLIPAWIIAHNRAMYYASREAGERRSACYYTEFDIAMKSQEELIDWARGSMDWKDVEMFAVLVPRESVKLVPGDMWTNAGMKVI